MKGNFYDNERVALFIDGSNLYSAARSLGFDIDYRRLLKVFREKGRLVRAYYYTALVENEEYSPIRPLVDWLDYNGYRLVTKPAREYVDAVTDYATAFDAAESEAIRRRRNDFSRQEQQRLTRALSMLRVATDTAATPQERERGYDLARRELDGLIVLPERTRVAVERGIAGELDG